MNRYVVVAALAALAACGPSAREIRAARDAEYDAPRDQVLRRATAAVAASYPVSMVDDASATIMTVTRWYDSTGTYIHTDEDGVAEHGIFVITLESAVSLGFRVRVVGERPPYRVVVEPVAREVRRNYSAPVPFLPDDPAMPGWVVGKTDRLQLDVHRRMGAASN